MKKPVKIFARNVEASALGQFQSAMEQDFARRGALMPDAHTGYSLPIGGVIATENMVVPAWVGYDIGCGMCALPTSFSAELIRSKRQTIFEAIYQSIPVGFDVNKKPVDTRLNKAGLSKAGQHIFEDRHGFRALGSLGSGNHFIEIGPDETGLVWVVIHSGSRGIGHGLATEYMKQASGTDKPKEGHFGFRVDSVQGQAYLQDMRWAIDFALENRREMMRRVEKILHSLQKGQADWGQLINRTHNHADLKDGLWIHRKGATQAEEGMMGVIPGNMRDGSFIVRGKGNPEALWSSSHGAGRAMSRKEARRRISGESFKASLKGVTARVDKNTLDEAPEAYKNIFEVMAEQSDLVEVVHHIRPLINIKG